MEVHVLGENQGQPKNLNDTLFLCFNTPNSNYYLTIHRLLCIFYAYELYLHLFIWHTLFYPMHLSFTCLRAWFKSPTLALWKSED